MNFEHIEYLPKTEKRIERLQKIVAGRPVVILVPGPSIYELEERIEELKDVDICYFGLNSYTVIETRILNKINKRFSAIMCSSREGIPGVLEDILDFLDRDEDNVFISSYFRGTFGLVPKYFDSHYFFNKHGDKFIFFNLGLIKTLPTPDKPLHFMVSNSLLVLIQMAIVGRASSVVLFGADGGFSKDPDKWFYRQNDPGYRSSSDGKVLRTAKKDIIAHTNDYCNGIASITISNLYDTYDFDPIDILNCSKDSLYTPFPKIAYDDAFKYLGGIVYD